MGVVQPLRPARTGSRLARRHRGLSRHLSKDRRPGGGRGENMESVKEGWVDVDARVGGGSERLDGTVRCFAFYVFH